MACSYFQQNKSTESIVSIAEPMEIVDLLETRKQQTLWM